MKELPTVEKFLRSKNYNLFATSPFTEIMIEFAKMHVHNALESADNNAKVEIIDWEQGEMENSTPVYGVDSNSILNAYPDELIK